MKSRIKFGLLIFCMSSLTISCGEDPGDDNTDNSPKNLPHFGIHDTDSKGDTIYYTVPKFSFINQNGSITSHKDYEGKIYVTDFFFTTCPTICPIMSTQMSRLQSLLMEKELLGDVLLLSHTINPEYDRPDTLKAYAKKMGADTTSWKFVTGDRKDIYRQAKDGYFINALESDTAQGGFIHSDNFILIDREMHIRGYYDGTSTKEVDQLLNDIQVLMQE